MYPTNSSILFAWLMLATVARVNQKQILYGMAYDMSVQQLDEYHQLHKQIKPVANLLASIHRDFVYFCTKYN